MKYKLLRLSLLSMLVMFFGGLAYAQGSTVTDELTQSTFGVTGTTYTAVTGISATSSAVYSAQMAGGNDAIQMRSNNSNSGIVTTASGGTVKSIKVEWNSNTADARILDVYGKESAYSAPTDLYSADTQGTNIASFTKSDGDKEITIDGSYEFIGFRSKSGAMYIDKITIVWENNTSDTRTETSIVLGDHAATAIVGEQYELPTATVMTADGTPVNATVTWTSSNEDVAEIAASYAGLNLKAAGTARITASFAGDNNLKGSQASFTLTVTEAPYTSIADMLADITSTKTTVTYKFENLLVTYVQGSNTFVSDGQNGFLFYGSELGLEAGNTYSGTATGQLYTYNGLPEMSLTADGISAQVASEGNLVAWPAIAPADLQSYINVPVTIENAEFVSASGKNLTFKVGDAEFSVYNNWSIDIEALVAEKIYTLKGVGSVYSKSETTTYQLYLASFEEKAEEVWAWADIKADFTNGSFFTANDADVTTAGLKMNADGTFSRVAADNVTANAIITGKFHSNEHGISNFSAQVKVEGPVKISFGTCAWGGNVTVKDETGAEVVNTFTTNTGACYHNNKTDNIVSVYYKGEAATLTIAGGAYVPYFAVEAVDPADIPNDVKVTFEAGSVDGETIEGAAPAELTVELGSSFTIPANRTLYCDGYTLIGWQYEEQTYAAGSELTVESDATLTAVWRSNEDFDGFTEPTTVIWDFQQKNGAPVLNYQNKTGIYVTQATVGNDIYDVKLDFDTNNGGKIANGSWQDWCQMNGGTKLTIPAAKGMVVSIESYSATTTTTIAGSTDYTTEGNVVTYTYEGTDEYIDIVIGDGSYFRYVKVVYPVPAQDEPGEDENTVIYSWSATADGVAEVGGTAVASDGQSVAYGNAGNTTIRLNGTADFSGNTITITLDKALKAGDEIAVTAYRNKNASDKQSGVKIKFEKGETTVGCETGYEYVNIDQSDASADDPNRGTEPNTVTFTVPTDADGSTTITLTRSHQSTNCFITKIEITGERSGDEPGPEEPSTFTNIYADFTNGSFFTAEENQSVISAGLKMNEDGSFTRVAADDETANAVITGKFHSNEHGLANFSATVAVEGPVKVSMGTCAWGGDVTIKDATGTVVGTFNTNTGACYHNDKQNNIASTIYKGEATTLTISGGSYTPYFAVEAVDPADIPSDCKISFDIANSGAEGVAPADVTAEIGAKFTMPKNFTLYKEGMTLTGWTDGTNTYATGEEITVPEASELNLLPVFERNRAKLADRTEAVTVKFDFMRQDGAPTVAYQNQTGIWVAQATVNGTAIDVKADFDTNNGGKFANGNWNDWAQLNGGTKWTIPSCKGATVSMQAYSDITTTTIDGQTDYTQGQTISYTIAGSAETVDVVIGDGSYYKYIQVVLPVVQSQGGGETYVNVEGTVAWAVGNEANGTVSTDIANAVQNATYSAGSEMTITESTYFESTMVNYKPNTSNAGNVEGVMIEYRVKMAAGLTFKPSSVSYDCVKVGTDGATYSWGYVVDETASSITEVDAATTLRNNGANSSTAQLNHVLDMSNAGEGNVFAMRFYISKTANNKNICIGNVVITGTVNGTVQTVNLYTLTTAVNIEEAGSINVYPAADEYEEGSEVTLTATENFGYDFVNWTNAQGEEVSTEAKFKYTVNSDATLTANFVAVETYELALTVDGTNDYMVTINPAPTVVDGKNMYEAGTAVQLTANQYEGLVTFTNWSDGDTNSGKLISMTEDIQLTAMYAQADIIAGWDFYTAGNNGRKADFYAQDNDADALNLVNTETGDVSGWLDKSTLGGGGYESFAGAAVNWRTGASNGDVGNWHWQTKVNAEAFESINVQFQMLYNYNAYQTYLAEYSLDGESWTGFGSITMTGTKQVASFNQALPTEANNQKDLYIRMRADKENSSVDGAASANDGNSLAMFFITGTPKLVDDGMAPVLVSTVPENGATGASASGKIVLTFDERVKLADTFMPTATLGNLTLAPTVSGKTVTFEYKGLEYGIEYTFFLPGGSIADLTNNFLQEGITLTFTTMVRPSVTKGLYDYVVENVDDLMAAINAAAARADQNTRYRIFIKDGEYTIPLSQTMKTVNGYEVPECITFLNASNVSFIGESRDGVIITNGIDKSATFAGTYGTTSKYDGIGNSDVFQIGSRVSGLYWQDLTVETGMDDATGRDLAIQDKGTKNIYKNVGLRGYQDTWTSNNDNGLYYFEDGYVRGRTDYMCGKGDIFWNRVELRQIAGGYAAVPSKPAKYGWIYKDCVINGEGAFVDAAKQTWRSAESVDGNYTLGRPWGSGTPIALFIDTKMNVVPSAIGWNEMSGGWPARFAEYNSMTSTGSVIDLSGRKKTFGDGHENNPVLTAEEALENSDLHRMYGDWDPTLATEQAPIPTNVKQEGNDLVWDNSNYALLWAVVKDGAVIGFTTEPKYELSSNGEYAVRAANEMGGLSEASETVTATGITTGIFEAVNPLNTAPETIYNINGVRVDKARKGLYIINGHKVVIK